jgi:transcriptional regulator with XRE-family HTH domain
MTDERIGIAQRLRQARLALGWTLQDVEARSSGEFKASALGAYERGERDPSAIRLTRLGTIYGIRLETLVSGTPEIDLTAIEAREASARREPQDDAAVLAALARFSAHVRSVRKTPPSEPVRVRESDCKLLGVLFGADRDSVHRWLARLGMSGVRSVELTNSSTTAES